MGNTDSTQKDVHRQGVLDSMWFRDNPQIPNSLECARADHNILGRTPGMRRAEATAVMLAKYVEQEKERRAIGGTSQVTPEFPITRTFRVSQTFNAAILQSERAIARTDRQFHELISFCAKIQASRT